MSSIYSPILMSNDTSAIMKSATTPLLNNPADSMSEISSSTERAEPMFLSLPGALGNGTPSGGGPPPNGSGNGGVPSSSPTRPENEYFQELADLVQESMGSSLQGQDAKHLRDMLKQLKEKKPGAVQEEDVSSSGPAVLAGHIGPMVLEALDGFLFVLNTEGIIEFVSTNVSKYLSFAKDEIMNKPIYSFVAQGDHENFSHLLLDPMSWQLLQISSGAGSQSQQNKERRSQSFSCRFMCQKQTLNGGTLNGRNNSKNSIPDSGSDNGQSSFFHAHVSAISLPYPTDHQREEDDFLNALAAPSEQGACLVCVARRLGGDGQPQPQPQPQQQNKVVSSSTSVSLPPAPQPEAPSPQVALLHQQQQVQHLNRQPQHPQQQMMGGGPPSGMMRPGPGGPPPQGDTSRQFLITATQQGRILSVEHRDFTVEGLFPKQLVGQSLQSICLDGDVPVLKALLDYHCSSPEVGRQLHFLIAPTNGSNQGNCVTVQTRFKRLGPNPNSNVLIECTVTRADPSFIPTVSQSANQSQSSTIQGYQGGGGPRKTSASPRVNSSQNSPVQNKIVVQSSSKVHSAKDSPQSPHQGGLYPSGQPQIIHQRSLSTDQKPIFINQQGVPIRVAIQSSQPQPHPVTTDHGPKYSGPPGALRGPHPGQMDPGYGGPSPVHRAPYGGLQTSAPYPSQIQVKSGPRMPVRQMSAPVPKVANHQVPQQFENLSPHPNEDISDRSDKGGPNQPDTLMQVCSSIFDETPPPSTASAPATSMMSPGLNDPGMMSPYARAQSAYSDSSPMDMGPGSNQIPASPQQMSANGPGPGQFYSQSGAMFNQQQGGGVPQGQNYPSPNTPAHHYHLYHPYSYPNGPGNKGAPAVGPDGQSTPGPKGKGKSKKPRKQSGDPSAPPKPKAPKGQGRKKKASAAKTSGTTTATVMTRPLMDASSPAGVGNPSPCTMTNSAGGPIIDQQSIAPGVVITQGRIDDQNTILKSLLQPEGVSSCGGPQPGGPPQQHHLLQQLLIEEERSPPLVSSSTPCHGGPGGNDSSGGTPVYPYPRDSSTSATPSPASSTTTPGNVNKRRSLSYDTPVMAKQQPSPMQPVVGSTTQMMPPVVQSQPQQGSVLVQLLQKDPNPQPTVPTSFATSPADKLAKENKDKAENMHRISTTVAEQLNRSRGGATNSKGGSQQASSSVPSTPTDGQPPPSQLTPQSPAGVMPGPSPDQMPYGQPGVMYPPGYYENVPQSYQYQGQPTTVMQIRGGQLVHGGRLQHPAGMGPQGPEPMYQYRPRAYAVGPGMRAPLSAPPFGLQTQHSYPGTMGGGHPGAVYAPRGPGGQVFTFEEAGYRAVGPRMYAPGPPHPDSQQPRARLPMKQAPVMMDRQISYEYCQRMPGPGGYDPGPGVNRPPAYPGQPTGPMGGGNLPDQSPINQQPTQSLSSGALQPNPGVVRMEQGGLPSPAQQPSNGITSTTQQPNPGLEPSLFDFGNGLDLDDESTRNAVFQQYLANNPSMQF